MITMRKLANIAIIAALVLLIVGCKAQPQQQGDTKPSVPLQVQLEVSPSIDGSETAVAELTVTTLIEEEKLETIFNLPEGVELVSGDLNMTRQMQANETATHKIIIKALRQGKYKITGTATSNWQIDYKYGISSDACIESSGNSIISSVACPNQKKVARHNPKL